MTVARPKICIEDGHLLVNGRVVSTGVPSNVIVSPATGGSAFVGATSSVASSRHVFSLGVLEKLRFLSLFRFKIWWMIPRVGELGCEIPLETQFLLLEVRGDSGIIDDTTSYVLLLPVLDGPFRASLEGAPSNELQFCVESGDSSLQTKQVSEAVFINTGHNPFEMIKSSIKMLAEYLGYLHSHR